MSMIHISPSREASYLSLAACEQRGAWSDQSIRKTAEKLKLSQRDAALASHICYGVVQKKLLLNYWIDHFSTIPSAKLDVTLKICLWIGLYQLSTLERVPESAAVNESVNLAKKYCKNKGASGMVNAILRAYLRAVPKDLEVDIQDKKKRVATIYSHPFALVELLSKELDDDEIIAWMEANNAGSDTVIQVNTTRFNSLRTKSNLENAGVEVLEHPWMKDCFLVKGSGNIEILESFKLGEFYVQDCASRVAAIASGAQSGDRVLDACAAPGGKSFAVGIQMGGTGSIIACDLHEKKLARIRKGAFRLGLDLIKTECSDARHYKCEWEKYFDVVLADVPCSGLGIIRKKPDIRYKDLNEIENLPSIQTSILENVSNYVKPGGVLVYSTCTILQRENQNVVAHFLDKHADFSLEEFEFGDNRIVRDGMVTLWPHVHGTDGFFVAKMRRKNV